MSRNRWIDLQLQFYKLLRFIRSKLDKHYWEPWRKKPIDRSMYYETIYPVQEYDDSDPWHLP